jgi:RND family efflux transporter MFP subunit
MTRKLILALALMAGTGLTACTESKSDNTDNRQQVRAVVAQEVVFEPRTPNRSFVGTVRPRVESDLGFRIPGKIAERLVQTGDRVGAGQALARLDAADLILQKEQAEAEVAAARASLTQAEAEDRRIGALRREGWSTASAFDRQKAAVEEARSRLNRAERSFSLAANNLTYATLRADADGIITAATVEPGQVVSAGLPAFKMARADSREAVVAIPETLIDRVRRASATVSLWSEPGRSFPARLRELSPSADAATRTYQARFTITEPPADLEFGLTATVTITETDGGQAARLPLSALYNDGAGPSVFVVNRADGSLRLQKIEVAAFEAREVLVKSGVNAGDMVVTLGVHKLDAGQKVRIVAPQG